MSSSIISHTPYRPAETLSELRQVLELQKNNLPQALSDEELEREGFVTLRYTLDQLRQMMSYCPQIIALDKDLVTGYALCLHPQLKNLVPQLEPLFRVLTELGFPASEYRVMGQVCIRKGYRGKGHFPGLYHHLMDHIKPLPLITEISVRNRRSLRAHYNLGFRKLASRQEGGIPWEVVIWEHKKTPLIAGLESFQSGD